MSSVSKCTSQKHKPRVMDHLMIFRSKLNNHLFYSLKCPHGGTAKYTQNEDWSKDSFHINYCFDFFFFCTFSLFIKNYKCLQHKSIQLAVIEIFTSQNWQAWFYFQHRFHTPQLLSLLDCFVLLHKTKIRTLKKDNYTWEKYTRAQIKDISIYSLAQEDS